jgi:hypothetical protein
MSYSCAQRLIIFGTTYSCELLYSALKFIKSNYRSVQTSIKIMICPELQSSKCLKILKVSWTSHASDVRELRCGHPCYTASTERLISEWLIWKGYGRKLSWLNIKVVWVFAWRDWGKPWKPSVRIAGLRAKTWTRDLPNKKQNCWPLGRDVRWN